MGGRPPLKRRVIAKDFDDPEVRALPSLAIADIWSEEARRRYGPPADVHPDVARRIDREQLTPVLDIGCGSGALADFLRGRWIGVDRSVTRLREATGPRVRADALHLPFADASFGAAAALYVLYFFADPLQAAAEARRVLRPGGLFAVCAPSRHDVPELAHALPPEDEVFVSEDIPELLGTLYEDVELYPWDAPMFRLADAASVRDYLYSYAYPRLTWQEAEHHAGRIATPLHLTKRGAWAVGRKPRP